MADKKTHWKATMNPDYLGAWALQPGEEPVLTIIAAGQEMVIGSDGKKEECLVVRYKGVGPGKMIVNATNAKALSKVAGSPFLEDWKGVNIKVYTERVKAFGDVVDAIRIRPTKPKAAAPVPKCTDCGKEVKPAFNKTAQELAQYTQERYHKVLCAECATKAAEEAASE